MSITPLRSLFLLSALYCSQAFAVPAVSAYDAWVRANPPGMAMTAGYLTIHNNSDHAIALREAHSPLASRIEIHETRIDDGMARMRQIKQVSITAGQQVQLSPEGIHLMIWIKQDLPAPGRSIPIQLVFDNGLRLTVQAQVRHGGASDHHHHHH